jgi:arsenite methyltransferase
VKAFQVYDKPMCCSTGVCGPQVDPVLPRFAADLDWLKSQGNRVERFNLAQQPAAFVQNNDVHQLLVTEGTGCLPVIVVDGRIVSRGEYPAREMLDRWAQSLVQLETSPSPIQERPCCGGTKSC